MYSHLRLIWCVVMCVVCCGSVLGWTGERPWFKSGILVLPFQARHDVPADKAVLGVALQNVLEHMLILHRDLEESWFLWHMGKLFPDEQDWQAWVHGQAAVPAALNEVRLRHLLTGHINFQGDEVRAHIQLLDRSSGQQLSRALPVDLPELARFRQEVLEVLEQAGIPVPEGQKPKMLWPEDLPLPAFALLGQGLYEDFAVFEYHQGQPSYNLKPFEAGLRLAPRSYLLRNALGWLAYRQQRYAEAVHFFEEALAVNPAGADAADGMVKAAHRLGDETREEHWAREQARIQGQDIQVALAKLHNRRGHTAYHHQDYAMASRLYEQAVQFDPTKVAYATNLAEAYRQMERFKDGLQILTAALQRVSFPEDLKALHLARARLHRAWGDSLHHQAAEHDKAIHQYRAALAIDTIYQRVDAVLDLVSLGNTFVALQQYDEAIGAFEQALVITRDMRDHYGEAALFDRLGAAYGEQHQHEKAIVYMQQALTMHRELQDQRREVLTLLGLALASRALGQTDLEIVQLHEALGLARAVEDREAEGKALLGLGLAHQTLSRDSEAIDYLEPALALFREVQDRQQEGNTLYHLGVAWEALDQPHTAIDHLEQALVIAREMQDRKWEGRILRKAGWLYERRGLFSKGMTYLERALTVAREAKLSHDEAGALSDLAIIYRNLGSYEKAIVYAEQALKLSRQVEGRDSEGTGLARLAWPYLFLKRYDTAAEYFGQALAIARDINSQDLEAEARRGLCAVPIHAALDADTPVDAHIQPIQECEQALAIERARQDRRVEASILSYLAAAAYVLGQYDDAIHYAQQQLTLGRERRDQKGEQAALHNLMVIWRKHGKPRLAIFYGKQAVNGAQTARTNLQGMGKDLQENFIKSWEDTYRTLADLLISEGRLPEAQQVLHLLKEEEYFDFVRRDASTAKSLTSRANLTSQEATWKERYAEITDSITAIGTEYSALRGKRGRTPAESERLAQLEADLQVARQAFQQFLDELPQASDYVTPGGTTVSQLREAQALMGVLRKLGSGVVALYTLLGEEKYQVIVVTANTRTAHEYPISRQQLNRTVAQFRQALWDRTNPLPLAQELYQILIGPIVHDLHGAKAETLMWSLDGALRYIPVAALHDGEKYLVERYRNVVFTPASQLHLQELPILEWEGLGLGMSKEYEGFDPLPAVPQELRGIIREVGKDGEGVLPGRIMLDDAFNQENLLDALQDRYPVVHIASHFHLQPGNEEDSFLLLGNGKLSVAQMKRLHDQLFEDVELLTLSACNTAVGGRAGAGKEIESFGVEAQRQGAKAVIATLWPVADDSTKTLMQTFYRLRATQHGMVKAEALRQAQLSLLYGVKDAPPVLKGLYSHPFFWAPFILIGNWR